MRKLKLDLEQLEVTSFETDAGDGPRGTVNGHNPPEETRYEMTCQWSCANTRCDEYTCAYSCPAETCVAVCGGPESQLTICVICMID